MRDQAASNTLASRRVTYRTCTARTFPLLLAAGKTLQGPHGRRHGLRVPGRRHEAPSSVRRRAADANRAALCVRSAAAAATSSAVHCGTCPSMFPVAGISTGTTYLGPAVTARSASRPSRRRLIRGPRNRGSTPAEVPADVVMADPPSGIARQCDCPGVLRSSGPRQPGAAAPRAPRRHGRAPRLCGRDAPVGGAERGPRVTVTLPQATGLSPASAWAVMVGAR